jgi:hypothetical protein
LQAEQQSIRKKLTDKTVSGNKAPKSGRLEIWDKVLPGFGVRITDKGTKTYFVMYRLRGAQRRYKVGDASVIKLGKARDRAREVMRLVKQGKDPGKARIEQAAQTTVDGITIEAKIEDYFRAREAGKWRSEKHWAGATSKETRRIFRQDILSEVGHRPIAQITDDDLRKIVEAKSAVMPIQANRIISALRPFFDWATDQRIKTEVGARRIPLLASSPAAQLRAPNAENSRDRVLTEGEIKLFWRASDDLGWPFRDLFR